MCVASIIFILLLLIITPENMKFISPEGIMFNSKKEYFLTIEPMKENEKNNSYFRRMHLKLDTTYIKKSNKYTNKYLKNKYQTNEMYREYKKNNARKNSNKKICFFPNLSY